MGLGSATGPLVSQSRAVPAGGGVGRGRTGELKGAAVTAEPRGHQGPRARAALEGSRLAVPQPGGPGRRGPSDGCGGVSLTSLCPSRLRGLEQAPAGPADRRAGESEWWAPTCPALPVRGGSSQEVGRRSLAPGT